ncbi:MAG: 1-acyl-sn-glycerol-3-phosphate acyltransferase [Clostridia bacterium]|nr:1-acyl-sn-glycerol-3-phosphate acyltransferase [Clostridia bacterium]
MVSILHLCAVFVLTVPLAFIFVFVCFFSLFVNKKKAYKKESKFYRFLLQLFTAAGLWTVGARIHVRGKEKLPKEGKFLLVGNHISNYDPIISWHVLRKQKMRFISKGSNFKIPFMGQLIHRCRFMEIDRKNPRNALKTIEEAAEMLRKGEACVGVYPEGTRSTTGELLPFHNSVFKIAQRAHAPIVVCSVRETGKIHKNAVWKRTDVYLDFIEVIPADRVQSMRTVEIGEYTATLIKNNLHTEEIA